MSSYVSLATSPSQTLSINAIAPAASSQALTSRLPPAQVQPPAPAAPERVALAPRSNPMAISQILLNAESLIASITGLKAHEVSISVHLGRYEF